MYSDEEDYYSDNNGADIFNEDNLNDEDYDLLHDILPSFRERVQKANYKNISDNLLKEYIWEANFDPDEAFEIVQENHKRMYCIILLLLSSFLFLLFFIHPSVLHLRFLSISFSFNALAKSIITSFSSFSSLSSLKFFQLNMFFLCKKNFEFIS